MFKRKQTDKIHDYLEVIDHILIQRSKAAGMASRIEMKRYNRMIAETQLKVLIPKK